MFTTVRFTLPSGVERDVSLDPGACQRLVAPSGWGKSSLVAAMVRLLTGDAGLDATGATAQGSVLTVGKTRSVAAPGAKAVRVGSAEEYRALLPSALNHHNLVRLVVDPVAWVRLYEGGVQGRRTLRDHVLLALPGGSVEDVVRELMGKDWRESDPTDIQAALGLQAAANRTEVAARAVAVRDANALAGAQADVDRLAAAQAAIVVTDVVARAEEWAAYDQRAHGWNAYDAALAAWEESAPRDEPTYDAAAHAKARVALTEAREAKAKADAEAERVAAEEAHRKALAEAEARMERERKDAEAHAQEQARLAEAARVAAEERQAEAVRVAEERARIEREAVERRHAEAMRAAEAKAKAERESLEKRAAAVATKPAPAPGAEVCPACKRPLEAF